MNGAQSGGCGSQVGASPGRREPVRRGRRRTRAAAPGSRPGPGWSGRTGSTSDPAGAVGDVLDLGQAELVALVDVDRAGQGEGEHGRGPGPARAQRQVVRLAVVRPELGGVLVAGVGPAEPGDVPGHVVVGQHPGRRCVDRRVDVQRPVDGAASEAGSQAAVRKSKLNAVCSSSGRR